MTLEVSQSTGQKMFEILSSHNHYVIGEKLKVEPENRFSCVISGIIRHGSNIVYIHLLFFFISAIAYSNRKLPSNIMLLWLGLVDVTFCEDLLLDICLIIS